MAISAKDVKALRDKTGAGMMDCKKALIESDGDFAKAEKILKEMGLAVAAKRSGRATNEGSVFTHTQGNKAVILELASETDFVAKNETFQETGKKLASTIIEKGYTEINDDLKEIVQDAISIIKENITLKRFTTMDLSDKDYVDAYIHNNGQIGVLIKVTANDPAVAQADGVKTFAHDCALHAAAFNPQYLNRDQVDAGYLKDQEEIFQKQALETGKPEKVIAGIVKGKLNKHLSEICFVDQPFVKDDKLSVQKAAAQAGKEAGGSLELTDYVYYAVGQE